MLHFKHRLDGERTYYAVDDSGLSRSGERKVVTAICCGGTVSLYIRQAPDRLSVVSSDLDRDHRRPI